MFGFICPVCKSALSLTPTGLVCPLGHCFDKAKEGYVHLLPANKMHSKIPGDTQGMVKAREDFLSAGHYAVFSDKLNELVFSHAPKTAKIVDAGCGEGYYTKRVLDYLTSGGKSAEILAFDISKFAVRRAAKKDKSIHCAVASIFDIPIADSSADIVINIFAPIVEREFLRILKKGGKLIIAVAGEYHLWEMKTLVYDKPYINEHKDTVYEGFDFIERIPVESCILLDDNVMISNLFSMTPYYWKTDKAGSERIKQCHYLKTRIHFDFLVYEKK